MTGTGSETRHIWQKPLALQLLLISMILGTGIILLLLTSMTGRFLFNISPGEMNQIGEGVFTENQAGYLRFVQVTQDLFIFLVPALLITRYVTAMNGKHGYSKAFPGIRIISAVIVLAILVLPLVAYVAKLNMQIVSGGFFPGIYKKIIAVEREASSISSVLMTSSGIPGLMLCVFIVALLPSLSEELFFRGFLQRFLVNNVQSAHLSVWIAAFVFSFIHFQFLGFLPRMLLGLIFGYLFLWSGNIWLPVIAHFCNNLVPVVSLYGKNSNEIITIMNNHEPTGMQFPVVGIILISLILFMIRRYYDLPDTGSD
ncbi:MAG: CPBP family intramembrane glutamic endopeptidase [Bacteroidales bacterium]